MNISNYHNTSVMDSGEMKKMFECTICGKRLLKKSNLHRHLRAHSGKNTLLIQL
jgi:uncharacterized Zn-finger protein